MRSRLLALFFAGLALALVVPTSAQATLSSTVQIMAGGGSTPATPSGVPVASVQFNSPYGAAADASGNIYVVNCSNPLQTIDQVPSFGSTAVKRIAGGGVTVPSTTPVLATDAALFYPYGASVVGSKLYIMNIQSLNVVDLTTGMLTLLAGGGANPPSTTPQPATSVALPYGMDAVAATADAVYMAENNTDLLYKVDLASGDLTLFAGGGSTRPAKVGIAPLAAQFNNLKGVAVDPSGNLYFSDDYGISKLNAATGTVAHWAGGGSQLVTQALSPRTSVNLGNTIGISWDEADSMLVVASQDKISGVSEFGVTLLAGLVGGANFPTWTKQDTFSTAINYTRSAVVLDGALYYVDANLNTLNVVDGLNLPVEPTTTTSAGSTTTTPQGGLAATGGDLRGGAVFAGALMLLGGALWLGRGRRVVRMVPSSENHDL